MKRQGIPIEEFALRNRREFANPGITFSQELEEWNAASKAGLDLWQWTNGEYPTWFMAKIVAWYVSNLEIEQHTQDASITQGKRNSSTK